MTTTYFLTGSYIDVDNDFEMTINTSESRNKTESKDNFEIVLTDLSSENKTMFQTTQPSFALCLTDLDEFITENNIVLYSKILTSTQRDHAVDKELEGFILNRLEY